MFNTVPHRICDLESMQHYPKNLDYKGSLELLSRPKISIVGTRRPNPYTRSVTYELAKNVISNKKRECTLISDNEGINYV